jgi:hypothetical protein
VIGETGPITPSQDFNVTGLVVRDRNSLKSFAVGRYLLLKIFDDPATEDIVERYRMHTSNPVLIEAR